MRVCTPAPLPHPSVGVQGEEAEKVSVARAIQFDSPEHEPESNAAAVTGAGQPEAAAALPPPSSASGVSQLPLPPYQAAQQGDRVCQAVAALEKQDGVQTALLEVPDANASSRATPAKPATR